MKFHISRSRWARPRLNTLTARLCRKPAPMIIVVIAANTVSKQTPCAFCMDKADQGLSKTCVDALVDAGEVSKTEVERRKRSGR
jgi:hypothetical protein